MEAKLSAFCGDDGGNLLDHSPDARQNSNLSIIAASRCHPQPVVYTIVENLYTL